jgi:beta-galactosidase
MREILNFNSKWAFSKEATAVPNQMPTQWYWVNLPHTWNAIDGQDGGNDYYRGKAYYAKTLKKEELPQAQAYYIVFEGANSSATLYVNGKALATHHGGYATWRVELTDILESENLLVVEVDNGVNQEVYPQNADFTFYGGLYRNVSLIAVNHSRFDLDKDGGPGIYVTPSVTGQNATINIRVELTHPELHQTLHYVLKDAAGQVVAEKKTTVNETSVELIIPKVILWHGRKNPYLYVAEVSLKSNNELLDSVTTRFGCRTFEIDAQRGFILNGEPYPLRGVCRHQDRSGIGNALLKAHHEEDMALICEMGANTIRLAHYQHYQYFYDLCDAYGMVVWAEIPYISTHMPTGRANTFSQMRELITQSYNHPSIVVWGLSNEVVWGPVEENKVYEDLLENHRLLNDFVHEMDKTRQTTIACVALCPFDASYVHVPDVVSYNLYYGWYGGNVKDNGPFLERFHEQYPNTPIGCSEYGCEALNWHTSTPTHGDYTEEYQSYFHEEMIKQLFTKNYLWATHVWNMFDFGADNREEGGENGQNHKGLVSFDRKYKKDAFYAYKAWLSDEPFVHICSKRYIERIEDVTRVTVYSNQQEVELFANGISMGKKIADDHFFYFDVPNVGETILKAVAGNCEDTSKLLKVEIFNKNYTLEDNKPVTNWCEA